MHLISKARKTISTILKIIVIICAAAGTFLSAYAGRGTFMGGSRVFMYFTIQSNIAIALICAFGLFLIAGDREISVAWYILKLVGTVSITLTGAVFAVLLAPILGDAAWNLQNTLTHVVVPVAAVADFFVSAAGVAMKRKNVVFVSIPPLMYVVYAGIGYIRGWDFARGQNYPYFFLNWGSPAGAFGIINGFPYMGCVWWIIILLIFLIFVGWLYMVLAEKMKKVSNR